MKPYALRHYVCPISGESLELCIIKSRKIALDSDQLARLRRHRIDPDEVMTAVEEGILYSDAGGYWFPIVNFIPLFLDFQVDLQADFCERHRANYEVLRRLQSPGGSPRRGETFVQKSFTREWALLDLDVISFGLTPEQRDFFVALELDWPPGFLGRENLHILEVGCGSGFESASLCRVTHGLVFGFDLNLALLQKGHLLADNPLINNAVCSLFRLPLRERSFDLVYSSGVLHHTFSTIDALREIARFRRDDGMLYVWVYGREDAGDTWMRRLKWLGADVIRPRLARLPASLQNAVVRLLARRHYRKYKKIGPVNRDKWRFEDSEHFIRDFWTPLYAHRQSFNEMMQLFAEMDMEYRLIDPKRYRDFMNIPLSGIGIRGVQSSERRAALS